MKKSISLLLFSILLSTCLFSCKKDDDTPTVGTLKGVITNATSEEIIGDVRITVFDSSTNSPTEKSLINNEDGTYSIELEPGTYYLRLSKQGYNGVPTSTSTPVSVTVVAGQETESDYKMLVSSVTNSGYITGQVTNDGNALAGVLIVASTSTDGYSAVSDAEGNYYIYNVPAGSYSVTGYRVGYNSETIETSVVADTESVDQDVVLTTGASGSLTGAITFLATSNGIVDVTLTHPLTKETIPGLTTTTSSALYTISNIPNGHYIARATFNNDTYVVDPDWIVKFGEPEITVEGNALELDFSVTGAVVVNSPTNDISSTQPVEITETVPTFTWTAYSSTSDYIIEVTDINGNVIWGGFTDDGTTITKNIIISKDQLSITYNSDGNASAELVSGMIYRWKIYASKDDTKEETGWKLISASEEQRGLFIIQ